MTEQEGPTRKYFCSVGKKLKLKKICPKDSNWVQLEKVQAREEKEKDEGSLSKVRFQVLLTKLGVAVQNASWQS